MFRFQHLYTLKFSKIELSCSFNPVSEGSEALIASSGGLTHLYLFLSSSQGEIDGLKVDATDDAFVFKDSDVQRAFEF